MLELELTVLVAAAAGAVAGHGLAVLTKVVDRIVRKTDTKFDDAVWKAVRGVLSTEEIFEDGDEVVDEDMLYGVKAKRRS